MTSVDLGILLARTAVGATIAAHGANKVLGGGRISGTAAWFASLGMRRPLLQARLAAGTEITGGIAFALGLATPVAAAAIVGLMLVAAVTVHARVGFFIFRPGGGWEYCFLLAAVAQSVAITGPGTVSLDNSLHEALRVPLGGPMSGAVAAAGAAVATAQLALFWRPTRTSRS